MKFMHTCSRRRPAECTGKYLRAPLLLALILTSLAHGETAHAQAPDTDAIRQEAVDLIGRLHRLEEQLLYPAHTRVSVFVSVAENSQARPHSVSIAIDDSKLTDHIYTQKEISALNSGGIQRLYTTNMPVGKHTLQVSYRQSRKDGSVHTAKAVYKFNKDENAENIEIVVDHDKPYLVIQSRN